ncbi:hypothetical protein Aperf_G00000014339 [Anoplocephala perfoliata]
MGTESRKETWFSPRNNKASALTPGDCAVHTNGYQIYSKELGKFTAAVESIGVANQKFDSAPYENPQGTNFSEVVKNLECIPYFAAYCLICLVLSLFNVPHRIQFAELASVGLIVAMYGVTLTGVIMVMMITMAFLGRCLRGIRVIPQVLGLMLLAFISSLLEAIDWLNFREHLTASPLAYSGFYAQVVRAMLICCDYASESEPVSWKRLFSESVGYAAFTNVFMPGSFFPFTDWKQWRDDKYEFTWNGPFKLLLKKRIGKATVIRKLSLTSLFLRILRVVFWILVDKYFVCAVDLMNVLTPIVERVLNDEGLVSDWGVISYATCMLLLKFNTYYYIFYNISRLVGDFQQFLLSPAFSPEFENQIGGDVNAKSIWKKATFVERLFRVEIETECLMPEGPCFLMSIETSSGVWRQFDVGLYNILNYIYIPWMSVVMKVFGRGGEGERQKQSSLVSNFSAACGSGFTFLFVLTFHHWTKGNQLWVAISFTLWIIERAVIQINKKQGISAYLERRFSPAWEQRIRCAASAILQTVNMMSFYCFVTNFETGWFMMRTMFIHPGSQLLFAFAVYCSINIKYALEA